MKVKLLSRVRLLATPWTAAYQAPPSMGFSRQEHWSGPTKPKILSDTLPKSLSTPGLWFSTYHVPYRQVENQPKILPQALPRNHTFQMVSSERNFRNRTFDSPHPRLPFATPGNFVLKPQGWDLQEKCRGAKSFLRRETIRLGMRVVTDGHAQKTGLMREKRQFRTPWAVRMDFRKCLISFHQEVSPILITMKQS